MKKLIALLLALTMVLGLVACAGDTTTTDTTDTGSTTTDDSSSDTTTTDEGGSDTTASSDDPVQIGVFAAVTGVNSESGRQATLAAETAEWYINEQLGGIQSLGGRKVEMRIIDSTSDPSTSALPLEQALSEGGIVGIAGSAQSAIALTMLPILQRYQVPAVTASATNVTITEQGCEFIFQPAPKSDTFSDTKYEFLQHYAELQGLNLEDLKFGIIYENSAWGSDTANSNRSLVDTYGLNLVYDENYEAGSLTDATALVTRMKNAGVDILFPGCYANDAKLIMTACASMDYMPVIFADGSAFTWPSLLNDLGDMVNGIISADGFVNDMAGARNFDEWQIINEHYEEVNGEFVPGQGGPTIMSIMMIYQAIEETGSTDPVVIRDQLRTYNKDNCPWLAVFYGDVGFDETGANMGARPIMLQWQNNKPTCIYPADAAASTVIDPLTLEPLE